MIAVRLIAPSGPIALNPPRTTPGKPADVTSAAPPEETQVGVVNFVH